MCFRRRQWCKGLWMWCPVIVRLPRQGLCVRHEPRRGQSRNTVRSVVHLGTFHFKFQISMLPWMLVDPPSGRGKGLCRTFTKSECFIDCGEGWVESTSLSSSILSDLLFDISVVYGTVTDANRTCVSRVPLSVANSYILLGYLFACVSIIAPIRMV
jgi:hypothetical protein